MCAHTSKTKQGSGCEKGLILFFLPTLLLGLYLLCLQMDGELLESVKKESAKVLSNLYQLILKTVHFCNPSSYLVANNVFKDICYEKKVNGIS